MNKLWNKHTYRAIILLAFLILNGVLLYGISAVLHYFNSGADRSEMLHLSTSVEAAYLPKMTWDSSQNEGRPMEESTLKAIEKDYRNAWYFKNRAFATNTEGGLKDYFTTQMLHSIRGFLSLNSKSNTRVLQTTLEHQPELSFYSADGTIVAFTDRGVRSYQKIFKGDRLMHSWESVKTYKVVMYLEDGFWRIRQLVEIPNNTTEEVTSENPVLDHLEDLKGINYYPQSQPWSLFGEDFDIDEIRSDFKRLKEMGLNTVRIFVPYSDFGEERIKPAELQQLISLLDMAKHSDLKVLVTLFDFYGNYDLSDWTLTHRHAETIVSSLKSHPALFAWDVKNEPDLDFESRGKENVLSWLAEMTSQVKNWDPKHPVTIGWSSPEAASALHDRVDFVSFHFYKDPQDLSQASTALQEKVQKPILLEEYGHSSYGGFWNLFGSSDEKQASFYRKIHEQLLEANIPYMAWTLYDFKEVPNEVVGRLPWRKLPQKQYGLITIEGQEKKAYNIFVQDD